MDLKGFYFIVGGLLVQTGVTVYIHRNGVCWFLLFLSYLLAYMLVKVGRNHKAYDVYRATLASTLYAGSVVQVMAHLEDLMTGQIPIVISVIAFLGFLACMVWIIRALYYFLVKG